MDLRWMLALGAVVCAHLPEGARAQSEDLSEATAVAQALVSAFNRHDPDAMAALMTDDFELFYVGDDGLVSLASRSAGELRTDMELYFRQRPSVRSEIVGLVPGERFVAFRERIVGGDSSLAVYEVRDGRLRRAWYYPAESTDEGTTRGAGTLREPGSGSDSGAAVPHGRMPDPTTSRAQCPGRGSN